MKLWPVIVNVAIVLFVVPFVALVRRWPMHPDDLTGEQLRQAAALADGAVDVDSFDPWALFLRCADVMERWGRCTWCTSGCLAMWSASPTGCRGAALIRWKPA